MNLSSNNIGPSGAYSLLNALEKNDILSTLSLHGNNLGKVSERASFKEDSSDESCEIATDIMATSTAKLN